MPCSWSPALWSVKFLGILHQILPRYSIARLCIARWLIWSEVPQFHAVEIFQKENKHLALTTPDLFSKVPPYPLIPRGHCTNAALACLELQVWVQPKARPTSLRCRGGIFVVKRLQLRRKTGSRNENWRWNGKGWKQWVLLEGKVE